MTRCVNCGSHNTEKTGASSSSELGTWCHTRCRDCSFRFYAFHSKNRFAKCSKQKTLDTQIDVLADVIDNLRDFGTKSDEEIGALDDILDILLEMQEVSMETKEE